MSRSPTRGGDLTPNLDYRRDRPLTGAQFRDLLQRSGLAARRPVDDPATLDAMLNHADLLITAWDGDRPVGVARALTDYRYCCYLADLAVDRAWQRQGVGRRLLAATRAALAPDCMLLLLAAPAAAAYYPRLGFAPHPSAWVLRAAGLAPVAEGAR
jgi:GNAT superfamily N-acetyltransferase